MGKLRVSARTLDSIVEFVRERQPVGRDAIAGIFSLRASNADAAIVHLLQIGRLRLDSGDLWLGPAPGSTPEEG